MTDIPVIDPQAIGRLREWGGQELPKKMIGIFLEHSPERVGQIREGLDTGTPRRAETGAHSLKSSAGNVGATRLQQLAQQAEALAEKEEMGALAALLPALEVAYEEACRELKTLMEGMEG